MSRNNRLLGLIAATLVACGGTSNPADAGLTGDTGGPDTGPTTDAGHDGGASSVCDTPMTLTLAQGAAQTVMGDTTGHTMGVVNLGDTCGAQAAGGTTAPQQVIELHLPGTASDMVAVTFTLRNTMTDPTFDTTTQLRTACTDLTGATCFDDNTAGVAGDYRSEGAFNAPGGSTRYLVVGGYRMPLAGNVNVGPWQASFQTFVNPTAPTLASGTASLLDGDLLAITTMGMDPQSAATGVQVSFLDAANAPIGFDIDMDPTTPDVTDLGPYNFRPGILGMMNFTGGTRITGFGPFPQARTTATQLRIAVVDAANLTSNELMIPLVQAATVHVGDTCDATHVCPGGVDCTGTPTTVCTVPAAVATECAAAVAVTVATPTTTTTSATSTVNFTTGMGLIEGSCIGTGGMGDEHVLSVDVPATGAFDLIASTPDMAEMDPDTVLYDRTVCGDPSTETACNDDRSAMPHSVASLITVLNAAPGTHFIVVDSFQTQTMAISTVVTISLRPVIGVGDACDPLGANNRCPGTPCPTTGTAVCP